MAVVYLQIRGAPIFVYQCETQDEAMQGLIGTVIDDDEGLMLEAHEGVHTFGMEMPIDVVWMSEDGTTLAIDENVPPERMVTAKGDVALELRGGWFQRHPPRNAFDPPHVSFATPQQIAAWQKANDKCACGGT